MASSQPVVYAWTIKTLERQLSDGYVFAAHWILAADDGTYQDSAYGTVQLQRPDNLIPYEDLTEAQVLQWVQEAIGGETVVRQLEEKLKIRLELRHRPVQASGLPWIKESPAVPASASDSFAAE